jgi:uncharacterized protein (TIGR02246 family)
MMSSHSLRSRFWVSLLLVSIPASVAAQGVESPRVPLRKAIDEIRELRESYADAFNKKDSVTIAGMYSPDAVFIRGDGSVLRGKEAIREDIAANAARWPQTTIESDTLRVFGNTAWDIGTSRDRLAGGGEQVSRYLVVLRRGMKYWKISALALVPVRSDSASPVRMRMSADSQ